MWKLPSSGTKGALEGKSLPSCLYWCLLCVKSYLGYQSYRCDWDPASLPSRCSLPGGGDCRPLGADFTRP